MRGCLDERRHRWGLGTGLTWDGKKEKSLEKSEKEFIWKLGTSSATLSSVHLPSFQRSTHERHAWPPPGNQPLREEAHDVRGPVALSAHGKIGRGRDAIIAQIPSGNRNRSAPQLRELARVIDRAAAIEDKLSTTSLSLKQVQRSLVEFDRRRSGSTGRPLMKFDTPTPENSQAWRLLGLAVAASGLAQATEDSRHYTTGQLQRFLAARDIELTDATSGHLLEFAGYKLFVNGVGFASIATYLSTLMQTLTSYDAPAVTDSAQREEVAQLQKAATRIGRKLENRQSKPLNIADLNSVLGEDRPNPHYEVREREALLLLMGVLLASRTDDFLDLLKENFVFSNSTLQPVHFHKVMRPQQLPVEVLEVQVNFGTEFKTGGVNPFSLASVASMSFRRASPTQRKWYDRIAQLVSKTPAGAKVFNGITTSRMRDIVQKIGGPDCGAHSLKRTAFRLLAKAAADGEINPEVIHLLMKHVGSIVKGIIPVTTTTYGEVLDRMNLSKAMGVPWLTLRLADYIENPRTVETGPTGRIPEQL